MAAILPNEDRLAEIWCRHLRIDRVGRDDDFFALGGTSLQAAHIFMEIESLTGLNLPITVLFDAPTVSALSRYLVDRRDAGVGPLVLLKNGDDASPLFLVHPVGGAVMVYRELAMAMKTADAVYGIPASGLGGEGPLHGRVEDMARAYCDLVVERQPTGPYCLAGYSAGGIIAFAMAQRMIEMGRAVRFLGLIDTHYVFRRTGEQVSAFRRLLAHIAYARQRGVRNAALDFLANRRYVRQLRRAEAMLDAAGTTFEQRRERLVRQAFETHGDRPDSRYALASQLQQLAINFYSPAFYGGPIHLYKTPDYHDSRRGEIGWARLAGGGLVTATIPGHHLSLITGENALTLAAILTRDLESA